jgi:hypothetical protein
VLNALNYREFFGSILLFCASVAAQSIVHNKRQDLDALFSIAYGHSIAHCEQRYRIELSRNFTFNPSHILGYKLSLQLVIYNQCVIHYGA